MAAKDLWLGFALLSTLLWGLGYAFSGQLAKALNPGAALFWYGLATLGLYALVLVARGASFEMEKVATGPVLALVIGAAVICVAANLASYQAFRLKNATLVTMIQTMYPLFTGLFTWGIWRQNPFNPTMLLGYAVVMMGVGIVALGEE